MFKELFTESKKKAKIPAVMDKFTEWVQITYPDAVVKDLPSWRSETHYDAQGQTAVTFKTGKAAKAFIDKSKKTVYKDLIMHWAANSVEVLWPGTNPHGTY